MSLEAEIAAARRKIFRDGYDMSIGEIINLYSNNELVINPEYQRLFRWDEDQKTLFIESILLNIPTPPIFVFQTTEGVWELIDGLQRISTLLQFTGNLKSPEGGLVPPFSLQGTDFLPSLTGMRWPAQVQSSEDPILPGGEQLAIKRARIRVEILGKQSDADVKFELFQRLNTGGSPLSEQEVRSCIVVAINPDFQVWIKKLVSYDPFQEACNMPESRRERQYDLELVVRFLVCRNVPYERRVNVHDYLHRGIKQLAERTDFDLEREQTIFEQTFSSIIDAIGSGSFRNASSLPPSGNFSLAAYECAVLGLSRAIERGQKPTKESVRASFKRMWEDETFKKYRGAGITGDQRLGLLVFPHAATYFQP